ncbi:MAG: hypothetical protein HY753_02210 [Nitrospirae bacterium]|nr:hypothetical protein [Nitrospirota bacterium]
MNKMLLFLILSLILITDSTLSYAGWLMYHKPEFKGKVIDAETKEPIEGAVVVVVYKKHSLISGPGGGYSSVIKVKENLTDKNGEFYFASYSTVIQPNSVEDYAEFIIYKPGYGSYPNYHMTPHGLNAVNKELFFSKEMGSAGELEMWVKEEKGPQLKMLKIIFGIVELPKLKTREERLRSIPSLPSELEFLEEQKRLIQLINEEEVNLGLEKSDPYKAREFILHGK